jgi:hypothetical protein
MPRNLRDNLLLLDVLYRTARDGVNHAMAPLMPALRDQVVQQITAEIVTETNNQTSSLVYNLLVAGSTWAYTVSSHCMCYFPLFSIFSLFTVVTGSTWEVLMLIYDTFVFVKTVKKWITLTQMVYLTIIVMIFLLFWAVFKKVMDILDYMERSETQVLEPTKPKKKKSARSKTPTR